MRRVKPSRSCAEVGGGGVSCVVAGMGEERKIKNYELRIKKWPPAAAGLRASRAGGEGSGRAAG